MGRSRQKKYDRLSVGLIWGILLPMGLFLIMYLLRYSNIPFSRFITSLSDMHILVKLLSLCGFANLLLFLLLYRKRMDQAAKGVIAATFIYGFIVLISRFL